MRSVAWEPASVSEPTSDVFVGWRKMDVRALASYTNSAETNRLAHELLRERAWRPEYVNVTVPLEPAVRVGDVIRIHGGERVGVSERRYRVTGVRHVLGQRATGAATTEISGRWLKDGE